MRLVFPDCDDNGVAHSSKLIRSTAGEYDPTELSGAMSVNVASMTPILNAGRRELLVEMDVSHNSAEITNPFGGEILLALVRMSHPLLLLDVVDVQQDREGGLWSPAILHAGLHDTPIAYFSHLNAGEEYVGLQMLELVNNKFVPSKADLGFFKSIRGQTFDIVETPTLKPIPNSNPPRAIFTVKITAKTLDAESAAVKSTRTKTRSATLTATNGRWHSIGLAAIQKLIKDTEKRYGCE